MSPPSQTQVSSNNIVLHHARPYARNIGFSSYGYIYRDFELLGKSQEASLRMTVLEVQDSQKAQSLERLLGKRQPKVPWGLELRAKE